MRGYGSANPLDGIAIPPDTVGVAVVSTALAVVAQDWPTDATMVTFGSTMGFWIDMASTGVTVPSSNEPGSTTELNEYVSHGLTRQIPGGSTGYSITSPTSGVVSLSFWRRG